MSISCARRKHWGAAILALIVCIPIADISSAAQDRLTKDLAKYQADTDPVRRARDLAKLGESQVDLARKQLKDGDDVASLATLQQYLDEVKETSAALTATGVDAEKKPSGFKELQIALRETGRKIDDMIFTLPVDKRPFFREVRTGLGNIQNDLMDALFPRNGDHPSKKNQR